MNTGMCLPTVRLSGPESEARSQGRTEAKSYPQLVLGHKSVTFEKEADVVSHVSEVKGKKLFHLLSFTVEKSSLLIPSNLLLFLLFSTCDRRNNEPFFFPADEGCMLFPAMPRDLWLTQLSRTCSKLTPRFTGSVILLSFLFLLFRQVPTASVTIEGASALNRVRWAQAGKEVAVGDSEGRIWIYDVGEVLLLLGFVFLKLGSWRMPHPSLIKGHVL